MNFAFLSGQDNVWMILVAITDGFSRPSTGTSLKCPLIIVLIGQQISRLVFLLYSLEDKTNAGLYFPISLPFLGSKSRKITSKRSGIYLFMIFEFSMMNIYYFISMCLFSCQTF